MYFCFSLGKLGLSRNQSEMLVGLFFHFSLLFHCLQKMNVEKLESIQRKDRKMITVMIYEQRLKKLNLVQQGKTERKVNNYFQVCSE